jgi:hypothetical protein
MSAGPDPIIVIFSKQQVRHRKLAHFLKRFGPDALPTGPELAAMMGRFQFLVHGYDDDPAELYGIPDVRKFYQHFHRVWPYWFFFCDLRSETLTMMTLYLANLSGYMRLGESKAAVEYNLMDLIRFIQQNFGPLNAIMERAGMSGQILRTIAPHILPLHPAVGAGEYLDHGLVAGGGDLFGRT